MRKPIAMTLVLLTAGCGFIPTRIGQKSVPAPVLNVVTEEQKQAAELITHGQITPQSLEPVAARLSDSLGKPAHFLPSTTIEDIDVSSTKSVIKLESTIAKLQRQLDAQNKFLAKYAGTKLEDTGFSIVGPGMFTLVIGLIVLGVACPPAMTLLFFAFRRLKAAAGIVVNSIEDAAKSPEAAAAVDAIKSNVAEKMQRHSQQTSALKNVITNLKS